MSAASSSTWANDFPDQPASAGYGVGLIGVVKGFARSVLGLGRVMSGAMARLEGEGAEPMSANAGYDFPRVMVLLRRAVHMADALKARLFTPAVAEFLAMARFRAARTSASAGANTGVRASARDERPRAAEPACLGDILFQINFTRSDPKTRQQLQQAIENMSDREVLTYIYADLREASEMLGETKLAAQVEAMACKASTLLDAADAAAAADEALDDVALEMAVTRVADYGDPDEDLDDDLDEDFDPEPTPLVRPSWRTVGRGPP